MAARTKTEACDQVPTTQSRETVWAWLRAPTTKISPATTSTTARTGLTRDLRAVDERA